MKKYYFFNYPTKRAMCLDSVLRSDAKVKILIPNVLYADGFIWHKVLYKGASYYVPETFYPNPNPPMSSSEDARSDRLAILKERNPVVYDVLLASNRASLPPGNINNLMVEKWRNYYSSDEFFQGPLRRGWHRILDSGDIKFVNDRLASYGLPKTVVFLGLVESSWFPHNDNFAGAAGYWQFIRPTALRYGLSISSSCDDRLCPKKSTDAACLYLLGLYRDFGNWHFAFAAYNRGETKVRKTFLATSGSFSLYPNSFSSDKKYAETKNYVPKIFGAEIFLFEYTQRNLAIFLNLPKTEADKIYYSYLYERENIPLEQRLGVLDSTIESIWKLDTYSPFLQELLQERQRLFERLGITESPRSD